MKGLLTFTLLFICFTAIAKLVKAIAVGEKRREEWLRKLPRGREHYLNNRDFLTWSMLHPPVRPPKPILRRLL
jgi:hypothetical protein